LRQELKLNVDTGNRKEMKDGDRKEINFSEKMELRGVNCRRQETIFHVLTQLVPVQTLLLTGFETECYN
jgi:hypothetical protein